MRTEKRKIGDIGEEIACRYLEGKGFEVVDRNYLKKWGEIDIVAEKGKVLHFVEVKTIQSQISRETTAKARQAGYRPEENVHPAKLRRLQRAIESYLAERALSPETDIQTDVVAVLLDLNSKKAKVNLLENVV